MDKIIIILLITICIAAACSDGDNLSPEEGNPTTDTIPPPPCADAVDSLACINQLKFDSLVSAQSILRDSLLEIGWIPFFGFECKSPFGWADSLISKRPAVLIPPYAVWNTEYCNSFNADISPRFWISTGVPLNFVSGEQPCLSIDNSYKCKKEYSLMDLYGAWPIIFGNDTIALVLSEGKTYHQFYARRNIFDGEYWLIYQIYSQQSAVDSLKDMTSAIANSFFLYDEPGS